MTAAAGALSAAAILASSSPVHAQTSLDQEFAQGVDLQGYEPTPAGDRFFMVPDGAVEGETDFFAKAVGNYAFGPALTRADNASGTTREIIQKQFWLHAGLGFSISNRLLLEASLPFALSQSGETGAANEPDSPVVGDLRLGARVALVGRRSDPFGLGLGGEVWVPSGDGAELSGDDKARGALKLLAGGQAGVFVWATNFGYLFRKQFDSGSLEIGDSLTYGLGAGISVLDDSLQIGPEIQGHTLVPQGDSDASIFGSQTTVAHLLIGAKYRVGPAQFGLAAGPGLTEAPSVAPRVVFSIGLVPDVSVEVSGAVVAGKDRDGDGILDADDACPEDPGSGSSDRDKHGCPAQTASDLDGDGVPDGADACPTEVGVKSDDASANGCAKPDGDDDGVPDDEDACPNQVGSRSDNPAAHGCPKADADGDGIPDARDACPSAAGPASDDDTKNGCPESKDSDSDGIDDAEDACPNDAGARNDDTAKNGCPADQEIQAPPAAAGEQAVVSFAGFQMNKNGSSRLVVKTSRVVQVKKSVSKLGIVYTLLNARVIIRNNRNPLLTTHFDSVVSSARLVPKGKDVQLVIQLREDASPTQSLKKTDPGAVLAIDFPARRPTKNDQQ